MVLHAFVRTSCDARARVNTPARCSAAALAGLYTCREKWADR